MSDWLEVSLASIASVSPTPIHIGSSADSGPCSVVAVCQLRAHKQTSPTKRESAWRRLIKRALDPDNIMAPRKIV